MPKPATPSAIRTQSHHGKSLPDVSVVLEAGLMEAFVVVSVMVDVAGGWAVSVRASVRITVVLSPGLVTVVSRLTVMVFVDA